MGGQPPATCSASCAVTIHQFTATCAETLAVILEPNDAFRENIMRFESLCMDSAEGTEQILHAIMSAHCPGEDARADAETGASCEA